MKSFYVFLFFIFYSKWFGTEITENVLKNKWKLNHFLSVTYNIHNFFKKKKKIQRIRNVRYIMVNDLQLV